MSTPRKTGLSQYLCKRTFLFGFFQKKTHSLLQIDQSFMLAGRTRRNVEFWRVRDKHSPFLKNLAGELNFHGTQYSMVASFDCVTSLNGGW